MEFCRFCPPGCLVGLSCKGRMAWEACHMGTECHPYLLETSRGCQGSTWLSGSPLVQVCVIHLMGCASSQVSVYCLLSPSLGGLFLTCLPRKTRTEPSSSPSSVIGNNPGLWDLLLAGKNWNILEAKPFLFSILAKSKALSIFHMDSNEQAVAKE